MKILSTILSTLLLLLAGCKSPVTIDPTEGSFEAEVGEPVATSLSGRAFFGTFLEPGSGREGVLIQLLTGGERGISFTGRMAGIPQVGTYLIKQLRDTSTLAGIRMNEFYALYVHGGGSEFSMYFSSQSGSLTVSESSDNFIAGSFDFLAVGLRTQSSGMVDSVQVTVSGLFRAKKGTVEF